MNMIKVVPYDPQWKKDFQRLQEVYENHLVNYQVIIEHVGSTSIEGLWAKPILDIDIIYDDAEEKEGIIQSLGALGYVHQGNQGIEGREAFKRLSDQVPYGGRATWTDHHLYLLEAGCDALKNHLQLRDYLRSHAGGAKAYSKLKKELAEKFPFDIDSYVDGKTDMIASFLRKSGMESLSIEKIMIANKK